MLLFRMCMSVYIGVRSWNAPDTNDVFAHKTDHLVTRLSRLLKSMNSTTVKRSSAAAHRSASLTQHHGVVPPLEMPKSRHAMGGWAGVELAEPQTGRLSLGFVSAAGKRGVSSHLTCLTPRVPFA